MAFGLLGVLSLLSLSLLANGAPVSRRTVKSISDGPVITVNFPDPAYMRVGSTFFAYATNNGVQNIPVAVSHDFESWVVQTDVDALPNAGSWSNGKNIWAPDVSQLEDGSYVLYYAATLADGSTHCIGAATSVNPQGPFSPQSTPLICPTTVGGAIDPSSFVDTDGSRYIVYKIDGNSIGHGGSCNNGVAPYVATPIMIQAVGSDGVTLQGSPQQIFVQDPNIDGPLVEAPSISVVNGVYYLFFSSNCYTSANYDVSYAISRNGVLNGGAAYTRTSSPLLQTGSKLGGAGGALFAPGGLTVGSGTDSTKVVFMADAEKDAGIRQMWTGSLTYNTKAGTVSIAD